MAIVAQQTFRLADRLLANPVPTAGRLIKAIGPEGARMLLHHQVSEQNRWYYQAWDTVQLLLAASLFFLLLFASTEGKVNLLLSLIALALVLAELLAVTPEIVAQGRLLDFLPQEIGSAERSKLLVLTSAYTGLELLKDTIALTLTGRLISRSGARSGYARKKVDVIDKANDGNIDR